MLTYAYKAIDTKSGQTVSAEIQAESENAAAKILIRKNLAPIEIVAKGEKSTFRKIFKKRIKPKEKVLFTRQLATLVNAGLPVTQSLRNVQEQMDNPEFIRIAAEVTSSVEGGMTLSDSFKKHPKVFNNIYTSLIQAGETSGTLDKTLERIATQQEKDADINSKIKGAMIYPAIVLLVIVGVLTFMLTTVLPQIKTLYDDLEKELPLITQALVAMSDFMINFWWLILLFLGIAIYGLKKYVDTEPGRKMFDSFKMKVPIFGNIFKKLYMARFCRAGNTLLASGVQMIEMLKITSEAVNNVHVKKDILEATKKVKGGKALSLALKGRDNFLDLVPQMISIGEKSGTLDQMLGKTATFYEDELDNQIKNLSKTIEPVLMMVLGVVAAIVIAAILLPVYSLVGTSLN